MGVLIKQVENMQDTMRQPSVEVFGLKVLEPVTALTDLLVAAVCFYAFYRMHTSAGKARALFYFKYFFLLMGLATTVGGIIGHAFVYAFGFAWKIPGWIISMVSVAFMERGAILHAKPLLRPVIGNIFAVVNILELLTFMFIAIYTLNFYFVEVHAAYGLLIVVFSFECFVYFKTKDKGSKLMMIGVFLAAVSAVVHVSRFSLDKWFNYFDISHVIMAISAYVFYLGISRINVITRI